MTVNAINGSLLSAFSAVVGRTLSTLSAINGQSLAVGTPGVATSMIFIDGGDHVTNADDKWDSDNPSIAASETGAHGRCYDNASVRERKAISPALSTVSGGVRFKPTSDVNDNVLRFMDTTSTVQVAVRYMAGGALQVNRGNTPTQLAISSSGLMSTGNWYYVELAVTINNSTGSYTAKLYNDSGTLLATLTASSVDTQETANANTNLLDCGGINANTFTEDAWLDNSGGLYGPLRVETVYPTGNGATNQGTRAGVDSGANWSQADEAQNNDATDYIRLFTNGHIELFTFPARALTGAIHAVQVSPVARRSGAVGGMTFRPICRIGGVNYAGATKTLTDSFITHPHCFGVSPATGLAWTESELASAQFGAERVAGTETTVSVDITQCAIEVICSL